MQNAKCKMKNGSLGAAWWLGQRLARFGSNLLDNAAASRGPSALHFAFCVLHFALCIGCHGEPLVDLTSVSEPPTVRLVHPTRRTIIRAVRQPSFVESYERTSVFPKMSAYIEEWMVDIGDTVKKGDVLATLFVPEIVEDFNTKKDTVELDKERVELALKLVDVASADVEAAKARLQESEKILADYQAQVDRWDVQTRRLNRETDRGVVDPQVLLETQRELKADIARRDAAKATILKAKAELLSQDATLAKAKVDVSVAKADLVVAESDARRMEAWVGYLKLYAPFDGVIVARNANTGDFVLPATGDPTAMARAPHLSPSGQAAPIYVVDRIDVVRIFVDIPEEDADFVDKGSKGNVFIRAYRNQEIPASVTRTSWGLNVTSRTLRAEIDLHNPDAAIRPGMYAVGTVVIERPDVHALPLEALFGKGDQSSCWMYHNGKAVQTEIETGVSDGEWIEVTHRRVVSDAAPHAAETWMPVDGREQVIVGDLSLLTDGTAVQLAGEPQHSRKE
jgi:HlyD family secretion protein